MPRTLHVDQYLSFRRSSKLIFIRGHQPEYGDEQADAGRYTAEPVSREQILRRERGQGKNGRVSRKFVVGIFPPLGKLPFCLSLARTVQQVHERGAAYNFLGCLCFSSAKEGCS